MNFAKESRIGSWYEAILLNSLFITLSKMIAEAGQLGRTEIEKADNMKNLAGFFGLNIPYRMTLTQLKNMTYCIPALMELAVQSQNILRFHIDANQCYKDLMNVKLPNKWDTKTVFAVYSLLEQNAKTYHLGKDNMPLPRYYGVNNIDLSVLRAKALEIRVKNMAFFPDLDSLHSTCIPKSSQVPQNAQGFFGQKIPCVTLNDKRSLAYYLAEPNVVVAF